MLKYFERRRRAARAKHNKKKCRFCARPISFKQRRNDFCDHSCAIRFHKPSGRLRRWFCIDCDAKVPTRSRRCSTCRAARRSLEFAQTDSFRRTLLIEARGRRCEVCLNTIWCGQPVPLELDHIDGNSDHNTAENLRLLCPNCHAQTPTYKNKNRGRAGQRGQKRRKKQP